eukprot:1975369-Rhodomonas_salina.3
MQLAAAVLINLRICSGVNGYEVASSWLASSSPCGDASGQYISFTTDCSRSPESTKLCTIEMKSPRPQTSTGCSRSKMSPAENDRVAKSTLPMLLVSAMRTPVTSASRTWAIAAKSRP